MSIGLIDASIYSSVSGVFQFMSNITHKALPFSFNTFSWIYKVGFFHAALYYFDHMSVSTSIFTFFLSALVLPLLKPKG